MGQPHKHADVIKAWADGATIEYFDSVDMRWKKCMNNIPYWHESGGYRVKPEEKKPVVRWLWAMKLKDLLVSGNSSWYCTTEFYSEEEFRKEYPMAEFIKLEGSATEFPD